MDDGRSTIYDLRYTIYDIRSTIYEVRYSEQFSAINVQGLLIEWSSIERSDFLKFPYMTYRVEIYLTTKSTKSFAKLRMTAQSLTKNVVIE
jgi:hypothetical protein